MAGQTQNLDQIRRTEVLLVGREINLFSGITLLAEFFEKFNVQPRVVFKPAGNEIIIGQMQGNLCQCGL